MYSVNHTPYGELWNAQGTSPMPFGFTGEWRDPNDLLFLRARYYNPAQAAFLSLDPLEGGLGNVRTLNRFGYVYGDPVNFVDPSGMVGCEVPPQVPEQNQPQCPHLTLNSRADQQCGALRSVNIDLALAINDMQAAWQNEQVEIVHQSVLKQARSMSCVQHGCDTYPDQNYTTPLSMYAQFFTNTFQNWPIEVEMRSGATSQGSGAAFTWLVNNNKWRIEIAQNGTLTWGFGIVVFSESLIAHEMGHVFGGLYPTVMQKSPAETKSTQSLAVKIVNWYACAYKGVCVGEGESYTGDLDPSDWDIIGATLPKFLGGNPNVASTNFGRNWSRTSYSLQFHELAAEVYAAWALGYRNEYFDVFPINETIETIVKEANT